MDGKKRIGKLGKIMPLLLMISLATTAVLAVMVWQASFSVTGSFKVLTPGGGIFTEWQRTTPFSTFDLGEIAKGESKVARFYIYNGGEGSVNSYAHYTISGLPEGITKTAMWGYVIVDTGEPAGAQNQNWMEALDGGGSIQLATNSEAWVEFTFTRDTTIHSGAISFTVNITVDSSSTG